jgi:ComF family protein
VVPGGPATRCAVCEVLPPYLRALRSPYLLEGPPRELVHALKYGGWRALARPMGARMASVEFPLEVEDEVRLVVPTPVSSVRLRQRGYNQAALLASAVASARGWKCAPGLLIRTRASDTQTNLHPSERRANVAGAFSVRPGEESSVRMEHVLLVDDVWTTGATALACGEALAAAGARAYSVLTFARAIPELR